MDKKQRMIDLSNPYTREKFNDSLYCRFGTSEDPDVLKGKYKDRYVLFYSDYTGRPFPITKTFLRWNHLEREEVIEKAYPKEERIHVSEFKGETEGVKPDYVVHEERCGAAALLLTKAFTKLSREQNLLIAPRGNEYLWVYRLNGTGPMSIREKAKAVEIAKNAGSLYYYDALNEEIHRVKVNESEPR